MGGGGGETRGFKLVWTAVALACKGLQGIPGAQLSYKKGGYPLEGLKTYLLLGFTGMQ